MKRGLVQVYTGEGKGKTTAAVGQTLRALGRGYKVCFIQFFKRNPSGEIKALKKFSPQIKVINFNQVHPFFSKLSSSELNNLKGKVKSNLKEVVKIIKSETYDLVVLDEVLIALHDNFISEKELLNLIDEKPNSVELILTGRGATKKIIEKTDLVTEMRLIKHPFQEGIRARRGIEY